MLCCGNKSIKIVPRSIQTHLSNQHPNLHRFWSQLGPILGRVGRPSWGQVGTKSVQKSITKMIIKMITFRIALGTNFDRFWAPRWAPRGGPRNHFSRSLGLLGPSWGQDGPRPLQDSSVDRFSSIFGILFDRKNFEIISSK